MSTMPCGNCGHPMDWKGLHGGWYCANCSGNRTAQTPTGDVRRAVENTISPEAVAGPSGQPLWTVEARLKRIGVDNYTETIHVRAIDKAGALAVAKEMLLDWIDGDAYQITERMD